jgi:hypothetical protein
MAGLIEFYGSLQINLNNVTRRRTCTAYVVGSGLDPPRLLPGYLLLPQQPHVYGELE